MRIERYIGRTVELIYLGRGNRITQRRIIVHGVSGGIVKAFCLERQAPRIFRLENILAVQLADLRRTS